MARLYSFAFWCGGFLSGFLSLPLLGLVVMVFRVAWLLGFAVGKVWDGRQFSNVVKSVGRSMDVWTVELRRWPNVSPRASFSSVLAGFR